MPNPILGPRGALACSPDPREWAGVQVYSINGVPVDGGIGPQWTIQETLGDVLDLLNGRGVGVGGSLTAPLAAGFGVAVTADITFADRVSLSFAGLPAGSVSLAANAGNAAWGFDPAGQTGVGASNTITAVSDWRRGNIIERLTFTASSIPATVTAPAVPHLVHSVPIALRPWGIGDADDTNPSESVAALEQAALGGSWGVTWGVDDDGKVWRAYNGTKLLITGLLAWDSPTFRDALGFDGSEVPEVVGDMRILRATYPCRWLLTPSRPWDLVQRAQQWDGAATRASDNGAYVATWAQRNAYAVTGYLDGPQDRIDRQDHFLRQVRPYMPPGSRVTLYQDWGDTRRALRQERTTTTGATGRLPSYSRLYTSQRDGEYGRILCRRDVADPGAFAVQWPNRLQRRVPLQVGLTELEEAP